MAASSESNYMQKLCYNWIIQVARSVLSFVL